MYWVPPLPCRCYCWPLSPFGSLPGRPLLATVQHGSDISSSNITHQQHLNTRSIASWGIGVCGLKLCQDADRCSEDSSASFSVSLHSYAL